ncbi:hypothetical protein ACIGMX_02210 [Streptomyces aquilus]|uniref:hypothetical protein n=1 Tax=Streptomyces aquilus TaxID=2548456 RepID=UPI0037D29231
MSSPADRPSPFLVRKALRVVRAHPGSTVAELNTVMSAYDRSLFGGALRSLREGCMVRVDESGRIWPTG